MEGNVKGMEGNGREWEGMGGNGREERGIGNVCMYGRYDNG